MLRRQVTVGDLLRGGSRVYAVYPWIQSYWGKNERRSIFITIIQLGKGE